MTNQQDNEQDRPARFQDDPATGYWGGATLRECGEHRTVGRLRAWCFDCVEWCYPADGCKGCAGREAQLQRELEALRAKAACGFADSLSFAYRKRSVKLAIG